MTKIPDKASISSTSVAAPAAAKLAGAPRVERRTGSRSNVALPLMCRYDSVLDFVATQSMNISQTGMFIVTETPAPVGSRIDFNFSLADGFTLLHGAAEVARVVTAGPVNGMGVRFVNLDAANQALIDRIVEVNSQEGRNSTMNFARPATVHSMPVVQDIAPPPAAKPVHFDGRSLRITLGPLTAAFFTQNALLNVRSGGFFIPAEEDVPLGTGYQVEIIDGGGRVIVSGKGKVVAKQDLRIGVRLSEVDKDGLARLRSEVEKFGSAK